MQKLDPAPPSGQRRLQREKDFTGERLNSFREVFLRHGLPGLILALVCLASPGLQSVFIETLDTGLENPARYLMSCALIFMALSAYAVFVGKSWSLPTLGWIVYLGALSFWEEWVFRLAIPHLLEGWGGSTALAVILSAAMFGAAHYFTLRWKWQWCVAAFIGGLALSRQMHVHNDLLLISAFHWIATYLNTPRPPGQSSTQAR